MKINITRNTKKGIMSITLRYKINANWEKLFELINISNISIYGDDKSFSKLDIPVVKISDIQKIVDNSESSDLLIIDGNITKISDENQLIKLLLEKKINNFISIAYFEAIIHLMLNFDLYTPERLLQITNFIKNEFY